MTHRSWRREIQIMTKFLQQKFFSRGVAFQVNYWNFTSSAVSNLNQPSADFLSISDTPNENEPMKSFLDVRSQSHTSIKIRRSLSSGLSSLFEFGLGKREREFIIVREKRTKLMSRGARYLTHKVIVSFQTGFNVALIVFVFFFKLSVSGINFTDECRKKNTQKREVQDDKRWRRTLKSQHERKRTAKRGMK